MTDNPMLEPVRKLYRAMPGAPKVRIDYSGAELWGEVENNEHYAFCTQIFELALSAAQAYGR